MSEKDIEYMKLAIAEAEKTAEKRDIPVGAVIVRGAQVIAASHNEREATGNAAGHAELLCIERACAALGGWRLSGCTMYVTLEPCPMCAGAIVNSRIDRVVAGVKDAKSGALGSVLDMNAYPLNHKCAVEFGVCEKQCRELLTGFFSGLRLVDNTQK